MDQMPLIELNGEQANKTSFPPGCRVYICFENESPLDIDAQGVVDSVVLTPTESGMYFTSYRVKVKCKGDNGEFFSKEEILDQSKLRYKNGSNVFLNLGTLKQEGTTAASTITTSISGEEGEKKEGIVLGFCDIQGEDSEFWYIVQEIGDVREGVERGVVVHHQVFPRQVTYRFVDEESHEVQAKNENLKIKNEECEIYHVKKGRDDSNHLQNDQSNDASVNANVSVDDNINDVSVPKCINFSAEKDEVSSTTITSIRNKQQKISHQEIVDTNEPPHEDEGTVIEDGQSHMDTSVESEQNKRVSPLSKQLELQPTSSIKSNKYKPNNNQSIEKSSMLNLIEVTSADSRSPLHMPLKSKRDDKSKASNNIINKNQTAKTDERSNSRRGTERKSSVNMENNFLGRIILPLNRRKVDECLIGTGENIRHQYEALKKEIRCTSIQIFSQHATSTQTKVTLYAHGELNIKNATYLILDKLKSKIPDGENKLKGVFVDIKPTNGMLTIPSSSVEQKHSESFTKENTVETYDSRAPQKSKRLHSPKRVMSDDLDDIIDSLIRRIPNSQLDISEKYLSDFTIAKIVLDCILDSSDDRMDSTDVGRYLKKVKADDKTTVSGHLGARGIGLKECLESISSVFSIRPSGKTDFSYWIQILNGSIESMITLSKQVKFSGYEIAFLRGYQHQWRKYCRQSPNKFKQDNYREERRNDDAFNINEQARNKERKRFRNDANIAQRGSEVGKKPRIQKENHGSKEHICRLSLPLHHHHAHDVLIGKGGSIHRQLLKATRCKHISLGPSTDADPDSCIIDITGNNRSIATNGAEIVLAKLKKGFIDTGRFDNVLITHLSDISDDHMGYDNHRHRGRNTKDYRSRRR